VKGTPGPQRINATTPERAFLTAHPCDTTFYRMANPFRERRYLPRDVLRIVRRAASLAEEDPRTDRHGQSLTRGEIERAAANLGLPPSAIARAADALGASDEEAVRSRPSRFWARRFTSRSKRRSTVSRPSPIRRT
jgi:hypothetical protein